MRAPSGTSSNYKPQAKARQTPPLRPPSDRIFRKGGAVSSYAGFR